MPLFQLKCAQKQVSLFKCRFKRFLFNRVKIFKTQSFTVFRAFLKFELRKMRGFCAVWVDVKFELSLVLNKIIMRNFCS